MLPAPALAADLTPPDSIGTGMPATGRRPPLAHFVLAYWGSEERWRALALLAVILAVMFGSSYLMVWGNELVGEVTDALVNRRWNELGRALVTSVAVSVTATAIAISSVAVTRLLDLGWRSWLTRHLLARWTSANAFYDVEREGVLKNADQRIAEDVRLFAERSLNIFTSFCSVVVQAVTFTVLLWRLSQSVSFDLGGRSVAVHGYMVYIAYGYAVVGLLVTHLLGRQLVALNMARQGAEADYRHLGMQLRENAEQIAFYRGGPREHARLGERFEFVRRNFLAIVLRSWKVDLARNMYGNLLRPLPTLAALPLYFGGQVTLGGMTRAVAAFGTLTSVLNYFSQAYVGFTEWLAVTNRLRDLSTALDDAHGRPSGFAVEPGDGPALATGELTLRTPAGRTLAVVAPLRIEPGARWLVRGPSGAGKSTLLRALAGLWPHGGGRITMPCASLPMFLPQRSYIPGGSLKAALCYPADPGRFGDDDCRDALVACGLGALAAQLQAVDDWQHVLSGGEQQRLAFARVLLHRPSLVFLDEATSALDPDAEQQLYRALLAALPAGALVSVTHRESLGALHDHVLELRPAGQTASS